MSRGPNLSIIGKKVGKLTVVSYRFKKHDKHFFNCLCDCGNTASVSYTNLNTNRTKSCGCLCKNYFHDLTNKVHNGILFKEYIGQNKQRCFKYKLICYCGNEFIAEGNDITSNRIKSCGCAKTTAAKGRANYNQSGEKNIYGDYRVKAKQRGHDFNISFDNFKKLLYQNCFYCDSVPMNVKKLKNNEVFKYNGVDRKDNKVGYSIDNCVSCCYICNQAKHSLTLEYFTKWIETVIQAKINKKGYWK